MRLPPLGRRACWTAFAAAAIVLCFAASLVHVSAVAFEPAAKASGSPDKVAAAKPNATPHPLQSSLAVNLDYCDEWLSGADFKSLKQTAEGLLLLSDLLSAQQGDADWQAGANRLRSAIQQLVKSAGSEDAAACKMSVAETRQAAEALAALAYPAKAPTKLPRPSAGMHAMMVLLDGTHADAKRALLFDEPEAARRSAQVLAELGPLLAAYRGDANWKRLAGDFTAASQQTASHADANAQQLRTALGEIYQRCQACHERR